MKFSINFPSSIFLIFCVVFLIYMVLPGPDSINDFPALPDSTKSTLEGDTIQVPNVAGYFSNNYRSFVIPFYKDSFQKKGYFFFPPLRLNYPPEHAFTAIKDQTHSTYLEELYYPFRESLFVNGLEPYYEDGTPRYKGGSPFEVETAQFQTKVTLRYYPSTLLSRLLTWFGICISIFMLWNLSKRIILGK